MDGWMMCGRWDAWMDLGLGRGEEGGRGGEGIVVGVREMVYELDWACIPGNSGWKKCISQLNSLDSTPNQIINATSGRRNHIQTLFPFSLLRK